MEEYYLQIRSVHIGLAAASGGLLALRGTAANLFGADWAAGGALRYLAWSIDIALLTAAMMLMTVVRQYPFVHGWLTAKALLLCIYVVLGHLALQRSRARPRRTIFWVTALAVFALIVLIARNRGLPGL